MLPSITWARCKTEAPIYTTVPENSQSLTVAWGQSSSAIGAVSVSKQAGGSVVLQSGSASSMTGFTKLAFGTTIGIKAMPNTDYKVNKITVGTNEYTDADFGAASAGQVKTVPYTVDAASTTVSAEFILVPWIKPVLSAPVKAIRRNPITVNANGTTTNDSGIQYAFSASSACDKNHDGTVDPATETDAFSQAASSSLIFTFSPNCDTPYTVTLAITTDNASATKEATINVVREYEITNQLCTACHINSTPEVVSTYDAGTHNHRACTDCHGDAPHNGEFQADACLSCHDSSLKNAWAASPKAAGNEHASDNVACASCHSPNGEVNAENGFAIVGCRGCHNDEHSFEPSSAIEGCVACHDRAVQHSTHGPNMVALVAASKHANEENHGFESTSTTCLRCHSAEGAVAFSAVPGATGTDEAIATAGITSIDAENPPTCAACHDPHTGELREIAGWDPNGNGADQYDTCTSCHPFKDNSGVLFGSGNNGENMMHHEDSWYRNIPTTHYDHPDTADLIEGYNLREGSDSPCFDCHGHELRTNTPHYTGDTGSGDPTIFTQWAQSGHAGGLLTAKLQAAFDNGGSTKTTAQVDAVMAAGSNGTDHSWAHYPWNKTSKLDTDGTTVISDRGDCQQCHTATGFVNRMAAANATDYPSSYDFNTNNFSYLQAWTATTGSPQAELLYCWACHSNAESGALRKTDVFTLNYTYGENQIVIQVGEAGTKIGASNTCVNCHAGRGNKDNIVNDPRSSRFAGHHGTAAGTLFSAQTHIAYEYDGQEYDSRLKKDGTENHFEHDEIGAFTEETVAIPSYPYTQVVKTEVIEGTGTSGPCVACHMGDSANHSWEILGKDAAGQDIINTQPPCDACHSGGYAMTVAKLEEEKAGYDQAIELLGDLLAQNNGLTNYLGYNLTLALRPMCL